jgi:Ca2+-transporting ATPase
VAYVKGAPQQILAMCSGHHDARAILAANDELAAAGTRVIAVAEGNAGATSEAALNGLTFRGLLGFRDPPAAGVPEAIRALQNAGIRTVMITGDQELTAKAVALEIGNIAEVFSRVDPERKLRIVEAYQKQGEVVAMFGDGVNDAAALRRADVGVAMGGRGTDVAKEAAAVVLQDDSFATIVAAVREGRAIFDNIGKFVFYLFSCNLAELLVLLAAAIAGMPLPLLPLQILWLNLVTDTFPALALAVEPAAPDIMERKPRRPADGLVSKRAAKRILIFSGLIALVTLASFVFALRSQSAASATTIAFAVLGLAQILHLGNARSDLPVTGRRAMRANRAALAAVAISVACLVAAIYFAPLARVLGTRPLSGEELLLVGGVASIPAILGQLVAIIRVRIRST